MSLSYSFHLSSKGHSVTNAGKLGQVGRHNLRAYESDHYNNKKIEILVGTSNLQEDVEKIYHQEFDQALEKYNQGRRPDRQITDYFDHVSKSRSDVAAEIIIQVGDQDFWKDKPIFVRDKMTDVFQNQVEKLRELCPGFKIASAVIHYDEASPHMHVVGVPVADGYKKGLEKQVAKTKVFTKESLEMLQDKMREQIAEKMRDYPVLFQDEELKEKEVGRNKDIPKHSLTEFYELKKQTRDMEAQRDTAKMQLAKVAKTTDMLTDPQRTTRVPVITDNTRKMLLPLPEAVRKCEEAAANIEYLTNQKNGLNEQIHSMNGIIKQTNKHIQYQNDQYAKNQAALSDQNRQLSTVSVQLNDLKQEIGQKKYHLQEIQENIQELDKVGEKIRNSSEQIYKAEIPDGFMRKREVTIIENYSPKQLERVFQRANIGNDIKKSLDEAQNDAQDIVKQAQTQADQLLAQAQQTIHQAEEILRKEDERKRKLDELERNIKAGHSQLISETQKLKAERIALEHGWTDKTGNRHKSIGELREDLKDVKKDLTDTQNRLADVKQQHYDMNQKYMRKMAVVEADLDPDELKKIMNDSIVSRLVQDTMFETCVQLEEKGLLKDGNMAFVNLNRQPIIDKIKEKVPEFIQNVKDHIIEHAERTINRYHARSR